MMIVKGFSRISKKGEAKKRRSTYSPLTITYANGTMKTYKSEDFMADGSLPKPKKNKASIKKEVYV